MGFPLPSSSMLVKAVNLATVIQITLGLNPNSNSDCTKIFCGFPQYLHATLETVT